VNLPRVVLLALLLSTPVLLDAGSGSLGLTPVLLRLGVALGLAAAAELLLVGLLVPSRAGADEPAAEGAPAPVPATVPAGTPRRRHAD